MSKRTIKRIFIGLMILALVVVPVLAFFSEIEIVKLRMMYRACWGWKVKSRKWPASRVRLLQM